MRRHARAWRTLGPVRSLRRFLPVVLLATACAHPPTRPSDHATAGPSTAPATVAADLRSPADFAAIGDGAARSRALFAEATRVLLHPRCLNCHPDGDSPTQGDALRLHDPPVARGPEDRGVPAMECRTCHQGSNLPLARVPGAPGWHLAPRAMAWAGRSPAALCAQLKDPARNGGKSLAAIVDHAAHDRLVAWGWTPGSGRAPAPGNQERFGALIAAWVDSGAACPEENAR
jgi:hypothetical protein